MMQLSCMLLDPPQKSIINLRYPKLLDQPIIIYIAFDFPRGHFMLHSYYREKMVYIFCFKDLFAKTTIFKNLNLFINKKEVISWLKDFRKRCQAVQTRLRIRRLPIHLR